MQSINNVIYYYYGIRLVSGYKISSDCYTFYGWLLI